MTLQMSAAHETATWRMLRIALVIAIAVIAMMALATVVLGIQGTGPLYDIVPDPAGLSGLPF